eukprot:NODE_17347_length_298_cov_1.915663_g16179_i0.p3 GENE.NODE_17347_length_298_cov_1.915663_g16179_i0~~NODE_17347_length_298_cov_1.915663_g16179_i0.p3  ORF type:complete len:54 (-),score=3.75 NODE_17347_length_298_cov_1.915663_g16179_i0:20-181(-)
MAANFSRFSAKNAKSEISHINPAKQKMKKILIFFVPAYYGEKKPKNPPPEKRW